MPYRNNTPFKRQGKKKFNINDFIAKEVIVYATVGGMFSFDNGIVSSFLGLIAEERQIANIGLFFSVGAIVLFVLRLFVGKIADKQGLTLIVNVSLIATAISMVMISWASTLLIASVLKKLYFSGELFVNVLTHYLYVELV